MSTLYVGMTYLLDHVLGQLQYYTIHALLSSTINTVIYLDNMDDFHTPGYELFFYALAFFVMLAAVLLHHRRRLAPTLIGLLLVCFDQDLSLFDIQNTQLAIACNLVTHGRQGTTLDDRHDRARHLCRQHAQTGAGVPGVRQPDQRGLSVESDAAHRKGNRRGAA